MSYYTMGESRQNLIEKNIYYYQYFNIANATCQMPGKGLSELGALQLAGGEMSKVIPDGRAAWHHLLGIGR